MKSRWYREPTALFFVCRRDPLHNCIKQTIARGQRGGGGVLRVCGKNYRALTRCENLSTAAGVKKRKPLANSFANGKAFLNLCPKRVQNKCVLNVSKISVNILCPFCDKNMFILYSINVLDKKISCRFCVHNLSFFRRFYETFMFYKSFLIAQTMLELCSKFVQFIKLL